MKRFAVVALVVSCHAAPAPRAAVDEAWTAKEPPPGPIFVRADVASQADAPDEIRLCHDEAVALVVDRSRSMAGASLELEKTMIREAATRFDKNDCVTVIAFDNHPARILPLTRVTDPELVRAAADKLTADGGTSLYEPIALAMADLGKAIHAKTRLIWVFTDGEASDTDSSFRDLETEAEQSNVDIRVVGVGADQHPQAIQRLSSALGGHSPRQLVAGSFFSDHR